MCMHMSNYVCSAYQLNKVKSVSEVCEALWIPKTDGHRKLQFANKHHFSIYIILIVS